MEGHNPVIRSVERIILAVIHVIIFEWYMYVKTHYRSKQTCVIPLYDDWKSSLGATNDCKSLYFFAPEQITGVYVYRRCLFQQSYILHKEKNSLEKGFF